MALAQISLFPLPLVLFPDGYLPLRVFEPRYLTMVADCMRENRPFGVVYVADDNDFEQSGTLASIVDFTKLDDGCLGIECRGSKRFCVLDYTQQEDGLVNARVEILSDQPIAPLPDSQWFLVDCLRHMFNEPSFLPWCEKHQPDWENAHWVSCRLAEALPFDNDTRQQLLDCDWRQRMSKLEQLVNIKSISKNH